MLTSDEQRTERPAIMDPLTGLMNRQAWEERLPDLMRDADNARVPVCLLLLDLDDFAEFNRTHGEDEGDRLLKDVAASLRGHVRQTDVVARVGGDAFALLLVGCSLEAASGVARRLCDMLDGRVSASAGGAEWNGSEPLLDLLARTEAALSRAQLLSPDGIEIASDLSPTGS
jgi:diguanylate cyclase (GGDEF)-like protein